DVLQSPDVDAVELLAGRQDLHQGRRVYDGVAAVDGALQALGVRDVPFGELDTGREALAGGAPPHQQAQRVPGSQLGDDVPAEEAGAAGNESFHECSLQRSRTASSSVRLRSQ